MQSMEQIARADIDRRAYLDEQYRTHRIKGSGRKPLAETGGLTTAMLPENWDAIKAFIIANIDHSLARTPRDCEAVLACVGFTVGVTQRAIADHLGVKRGNAGVHVGRMRRRGNKWLQGEVDRIAEKCPKPIWGEGKAI